MEKKQSFSAHEVIEFGCGHAECGGKGVGQNQELRCYAPSCRAVAEIQWLYITDRIWRQLVAKLTGSERSPRIMEGNSLKACERVYGTGCSGNGTRNVVES
jgi:hypothetical protein